MTNDEVKRILKNYYYFNEDLKTVHKQQAEILEHLEEARQGTIKAKQLSDMPKGTDVIDKFKLIDKYNDIYNELLQKEATIIDNKNWVDKAFYTLDRIEQDIVKYRYFDYLSFYQIGYKIRKDKMTGYRMHEEIINKIKLIIA